MLDLAVPGHFIRVEAAGPVPVRAVVPTKRITLVLHQPAPVSIAQNKEASLHTVLVLQRGAYVPYLIPSTCVLMPAAVGGLCPTRWVLVGLPDAECEQVWPGVPSVNTWCHSPTHLNPIRNVIASIFAYEHRGQRVLVL